MRHIPDQSVDMVLCDLPYGTTACKWDQVIPFEPLWSHYWRVCKPNAAVVLTASQPFTSALVMSQPKAFKCEWIWEKNIGSNFAQVKYMPMKEHENICVFSRNTPLYNPIMEQRNGSGLTRIGEILPPKPSIQHFGPSMRSQYDVKPRLESRIPRSVQKFNVVPRNGGGLIHPTQKPVALFDYLIRTYTNPGDLVLDNCAGSGTTAIAAEASGRRWLCMERDPSYYYAAIGRVWKACYS
jgi:site-specific DNA-methyltransferase (adenine-specific)